MNKIEFWNHSIHIWNCVSQIRAWKTVHSYVPTVSDPDRDYLFSKSILNTKLSFEASSKIQNMTVTGEGATNS